METCAVFDKNHALLRAGLFICVSNLESLAIRPSQIIFIYQE